MWHKRVEYFRRNLGYLCRDRGGVSRAAEKARVSRVYVSYVLHGRHAPSLDVALRLADAVGVSLVDLLNHPRKFRQRRGAGLTDGK